MVVRLQGLHGDLGWRFAGSNLDISISGNASANTSKWHHFVDSIAQTHDPGGVWEE